MGQPKQHVELGGMTFIERITKNLRENAGHVAKIIMVGQAGDSRSQKLAAAIDATWISNPAPENGPLSSIRLALPMIQPDSAMLMWPVDHPMIAPATVEALCRQHLCTPDQIIVPSIDNRRGHPSIFPAELLPEFFAIPEDEGARKILQLHPERIEHVITDDIWVRKNLNTPELLAEAAQYLDSQL